MRLSSARKCSQYNKTARCVNLVLRGQRASGSMLFSTGFRGGGFFLFFRIRLFCNGGLAFLGECGDACLFPFQNLFVDEEIAHRVGWLCSDREPVLDTVRLERALLRARVNRAKNFLRDGPWVACFVDSDQAKQGSFFLSDTCES